LRHPPSQHEAPLGAQHESPQDLKPAPQPLEAIALLYMKGPAAKNITNRNFLILALPWFFHNELIIAWIQVIRARSSGW